MGARPSAQGKNAGNRRNPLNDAPAPHQRTPGMPAPGWAPAVEK